MFTNCIEIILLNAHTTTGNIMLISTDFLGTYSLLGYRILEISTLGPFTLFIAKQLKITIIIA